jgi:hypothetical protein
MKKGKKWKAKKCDHNAEEGQRKQELQKAKAKTGKEARSYTGDLDVMCLTFCFAEETLKPPELPHLSKTRLFTLIKQNVQYIGYTQ